MLCSRCGRKKANSSGMCDEDEQIHRTVRQREAELKERRS